MDTSSSSKVTVEYHDPSGVFPLVSRDIAARLPLRNLNWQSINRPLRQIKSLHLDFVPDSFTKSSLQPAAQRLESDSVTSFDIVRSGLDARRNAVKERRHQIPGLQTSPYLKIYVLRCDDKDTYKTTERGKLREWIRDNATGSKKGKGENHDAFEWLILHVVVPDTVAASEPRWRVSQRDSEELRERKGGTKLGTKLPGKSTRTVYDKIRADFNETGKTAHDRVAQIRLLKDQTPADLLPTPPVAATLEETHDEREKAWSDLTTKFKTLILDSFDKRVRQYEQDVGDQEARRSMPGFNFCTFFIHKEGLAIALESIGLVEDAVVIYDELSLGLETVLREVASGKAEGTATTFAPYTEDIKERITGRKESKTNGVSTKNSDAEMQEQDYRERIVRSNISVFDFVSYIFSRLKALFLRIANAETVRGRFGTSGKDAAEDLVLVSEVCWRGMTFIHNNARVLRQDILAFQRAQWDKGAEVTPSDADIESVVCSWTYTVAGQILEDTASSALDPASESGRRDSLANGSATSPKRSQSVSLGVSAHPHRATSLPGRKSRVSELQAGSSLQSASESDLVSPPSTSGSDHERANSTSPGFVELVTYRAELVMMQRKMLEQIAKQRGWRAGWASIRDERVSKMEDVSLNGHSERLGEEAEAMEAVIAPPSSLTSPALTTALDSKEHFYDTYEMLSDQAMRLYVQCTQIKSAEGIMGDLAILKYQQGDYSYAVSYFQHVLLLYREEGWALMESEALRIQAKCLIGLGRGAEYARTLLQLIERTCERIAAKKPAYTFEDIDNVHGVLAELVQFSDTLDTEIGTPAVPIFGGIQPDNMVILHKDKDGFALRLRFHYVLDDDIELREVNARLVHVDDSSQEIWLANTQPVNIVSGQNEVELETNTVAFGPYYFDRAVFKANKLCFVHEYQSRPQLEPTPLGTLHEGAAKLADARERPWVFLYPAQDAFNVGVTLARDMRIDSPRHLEVKLSSGWNNVEAVDLRLKPASAGLRLHIGNASSSLALLRDNKTAIPGHISLGSLAEHKSTVVEIPYTLEQVAQEIFVRLEVQYTTSLGTFTYLTSARLPTGLPLDVDVNDAFHIDRLLSTFTLRTTNKMSLSITGASLASSSVYAVEAPPVLPMPMTLFERQPVKLVYKLSRNANRADGSTSKKDAGLALTISYQPMDELVLGCIGMRLVDALTSSGLAGLLRLLVPFAAMRCRQLLSNSDFDVAALLSEVKVPSYEDMGWNEIVGTLPSAVRGDVTDWLSRWHDENEHVSLEHSALPEPPRQSIIITVEVPNVDFVHEVSLSLQEQKSDSSEDFQTLTLGRPVKARLRVASTQHWSSKAIFESQSYEGDQVFTEFVVNIQADPDLWLVGGQRRSRFVAAEGSQRIFEVLLIPLKLGIYPLPVVDIQVGQVAGDPDSNSFGSTERPIISSETHYESAGQHVQVIRNLRTARVHIAESSAAALPPSRPATATTAADPG